MSFSRVGDCDSYRHSICNRSGAPLGAIFGAQGRVSADGPLPVWAARLLQRTITDIKFIAFLQVSPGELPSPVSGSAVPNLESDEKGALVGEVMFLSMGKLAQTGEIADHIRTIELCSRDARSPIKSHAEQQDLLAQAKGSADALWDHLTRTFAQKRATPAFGRAKVTLIRTGECRIDIDEADLYTTIEAKTAQRNAADTGKLDRVAFASACETAARQVFNFIRDLSHKHYHHDKKADLLTTTYKTDATDDVHWRRETLYGLMRLVISARRRGNARKYRNVLGIIAYAEAFQRHLSGWHVEPDGALSASNPAFQYDFTALRQSIESSLKVTDLSDQEKRQSFLFISGFVVAMFAALLSSEKVIFPKGDLRFDSSILHSALTWLVQTPTPALALALIAAWLLDTAFLRQSFRPWFLRGWTSGLNRALDAAMGTSMRRGLSPWEAASIAIAIMVIIIVSMSLIAIVAGEIAYTHLQHH